MIRVSFWGTRGSIVSPGPSTRRYGGNTACVQLVGYREQVPGAAIHARNPLIVLDGGTGLADLQPVLLRGAWGKGKGELHVLLSHYHWDHLIGLPFFAPMFFKGNRVVFYGADDGDLQASIERLFTSVYSPIKGTANLSADITYRRIEQGNTKKEIAGFDVTTAQTCHPTKTLAFRVEDGDSSVVYATDHEAGDEEADRRVVELARGADLLIIDAQYTDEQHRENPGYGHSSHLEAVDLAIAAGAKRVALFHHNPVHDDDTLDRMCGEARERAAGSPVSVLMARDGMVIDLGTTDRR